GADWAGASAALGDLNVYGNGDGNEDTAQTYGLQYECVELAQRWASLRFGAPPIWPVAYAYQMWDVGPRLRTPWQQLPNGGAVAPTGLKGSDGPGGFALDGFGGVHPWGSAAPLAQPVGWPGWDIARGVAVQEGAAGGYVLDGWGGVHNFGKAPVVQASAYWPG